MSDGSVGSLILNRLIDEAGTVTQFVYGSLIGSWPGQTFVAIYVAIVGYCVIMGKAGERAKEWSISALLLIVLGGIASNYGTFNEWVAGPILSAAQKGGGMAATGGDTSAGGLSNILDAAEETLGKTLTVIDRIDVPGNIITNGWMYLKVGIVMLVMGLLACAQYVAMVALLCIAVFSVFMMFAVGGLCLWFASFKETRFIFTTWLKQTANYAVWIFYLGAVSGIGNHFIGQVADILTTWDLARDGVFNRAIGANMLLTVLCIYMLLKASDWAAAITGGTASNTGAIGALGGMAGGALGGAANAAGGMAGGAAKWAGGALANKTSAGNAAYRAYSALKGIGNVK